MTIDKFWERERQSNGRPYTYKGTRATPTVVHGFIKKDTKWSGHEGANMIKMHCKKILQELIK